MKKFISVLLVLSLLICAGVASLSAQGEETTEVLHEQKITASRFETMLNNNYAFGNDFYSISKLIDAATISLLSHAENGKLKNSVIADFLNNAYGIDAYLMADEGKEPLTLNGIYEIIPKGFSKYTHTVTDYYLHADGTLTVYSNAETINEDGESVVYTAISRFAENERSVFGFTLLSCEIVTE